MYTLTKIDRRTDAIISTTTFNKLKDAKLCEALTTRHAPHLRCSIITYGWA